MPSRCFTHGLLLAAVLASAPFLDEAWAGESGSCPAGPALVTEIQGDLGPAPSGVYEEIACLEIRNDRDHERSEVAFAGIPMPRGLGLTSTRQLAVVGTGERRLASQFDVLSRWGGPVDDTALPIRWLQVSVPARITAQGTADYSLRRYDSLTPAQDAWAASISSRSGRFLVDTGAASFTLDPTNPAFFEQIALAEGPPGSALQTAYEHTPGAGPRLIFDGGTILDTSSASRVSVDPDGFEIVEAGPVKVVTALRGHFSAPGGASLCSSDGSSYERFGFTLIASFHRGSSDVLLQFHIRNECSDGFSGPWTDQAVTIERASWVFPFSAEVSTVFYAGKDEIFEAPEGAGRVQVEQAKGGGVPWRRRARVVVDEVVRESEENFANPFIAVADTRFAAAAQIAWMQFREPQGLAVVNSRTLSLDFISEPLLVGEGKGIWNFARLSLIPLRATSGPLASIASPPESLLEHVRLVGRDELERGLLVRAPLNHVNASRLFPSLGTDASSPVKTAYRAVMESLHDQTVRSGGQWDRAGTFGSQLWPDVQSDLYLIDNDSPADNSGAMNYWNPSGAELLEFLRSGDPRWVWDFALPQSWLQMFTAYLNVGDRIRGNRAGFAVTSGGAGEGQWHRSAFGSDDYSYNLGMQLAYALRPNAALRRRFGHAGITAVDRYDIPEDQESQRERFVSQVDITRQVIQHFEMLANCAEFVPGQSGRDCLLRLKQVVDELADDNLQAGVQCQGDVQSDARCEQPQQFMQAALMYHFFHRYYRNWGEGDPRLRRALSLGPLEYWRFGIPKLADGSSLDVSAEWAALLECTLEDAGTRLESCTRVATSDGTALLRPNKPHSVALLLMAHEVDPSVQMCGIARTAFDDPRLAGGWTDFLANDSGWWKGAGQMVQGMAFGVGLYDVCQSLIPNPLYFAQFADGGGTLSSQIVLFNPDDENDVRAQVFLREADGSPLHVDLNGQPAEGRADVIVPARGLAVLETDGLGEVRAGSVAVAAERPLGGTILYGGPGGLAGVGSSVRLSRGFVAPVVCDQERGVRTGLAVMNLESRAVKISLRLFDDAGTPRAPDGHPGSTFILDALGSRSMFVDELFAGLDLSDFHGILTATSDGQIGATVLQQHPGRLATLPVTSLSQPEQELFFAHFGDGGGTLTSRILLSNPDSSEDATVRLVLRDPQGAPLATILNGKLVDGELEVEVPPRGLIVLESDGEGDVQTGTVSVFSSLPLSGTIVFRSDQGVAGVGSSRSLTGFLAPAQSDSERRIRTGVALMNLESAQNVVTLDLFDASGVHLGSGDVTLVAGGSLSRFLDEIFPSLDLQSFRGVLRASSQARIAATAIQTRPGQYATLPVYAPPD